MAKTDTALVWSPRSNIRLYGDTAAVTLAAQLGVQIALGTDWTASGSMNMLRELQCADSLNQNYFGKFFTDEQLWLMVTRNAAQSVNFDDVIGTLRQGTAADVAIFNGATNKDHRAVIAAGPQDVVLVLRSGKPLYGDSAVISGLTDPSACDTVQVCGSGKLLCIMGEVGKTYPELMTAAGQSYPAFFCGTPDNEPSCVPMRPKSVMGSTIYDGTITSEDLDGDGIPNTLDNCPTVFNPIRPLDGNAQADADGDGVGDACDPCPLNANTMSCTAPDPNDDPNPNDFDGDGIANSVDNCPIVYNPDQKDTDGDGKGDVCDPCPMAPNPGPLGCPATIYNVKTGTASANSVVASSGTIVAVTNALVTGVFYDGLFVQVKETDAGYQGPENSGLYVYTGSQPTAVVGNRVSINPGTVDIYYGETELDNATVTVTSMTTESPPAPVTMSGGMPLTPAMLGTGGSMAVLLDGVIVQLQNVTVSSVTPTPTSQFSLNSALTVDNLLYQVTPLPSVGTTYTSITGILEGGTDSSLLEPRGPSDVVQ
jgi:hypothetical protein